MPQGRDTKHQFKLFLASLQPAFCSVSQALHVTLCVKLSASAAGVLRICLCRAGCQRLKACLQDMPGVMQFFKGYDRLLTSYMRHGEGIGLDLTVVSLLARCHGTR